MVQAMSDANRVFYEMRTTVETLSRLLKILYPGAPHLDIITLEDVKTRYPLTELGGPAMAAIKQSQRIIRANGNYRQIGLCEFHIGLIYFYWGHGLVAAQQFTEARRQWSFVNETASVCLTYFAQGQAQEQGLHYEAAMGSYGKTEQWLPRIKFAPPSDTQNEFIQRLTHRLTEAQTRVREKLWPPEAARRGHRPDPEATRPSEPIVPPTPPSAVSASVPQPIISLDNHPANADLPVQATNEHDKWYRVEKRQGNFLPHVGEGSWLLVNTQTADYRYKAGDLLIIGGNDNELNGSIPVRPSVQTPPFARIYLAQLPEPPATAFTRNLETGEVTLNTGSGSFHTTVNHIIGVVLGVWLQVGKERPSVG